MFIEPVTRRARPPSGVRISKLETPNFEVGDFHMISAWTVISS